MSRTKTGDNVWTVQANALRRQLTYEQLKGSDSDANGRRVTGSYNVSLSFAACGVPDENTILMQSAEMAQNPVCQHLSMQGLSLDAVPAPLVALSQLQSLNLSYNRLASLPHAGCEAWGRLAELTLKANELRELPANIHCLASLTCLDLTDNRLEALPEDIGKGFRSLEKLLLNDNALRALPASLCHLPGLIHLELSDNRLTELPKEFGRLGPTLHWLRLNRNSLTKLPRSFGRLDHTTIVDLRNNSFLVNPPVKICVSGPRPVPAIAEYFGFGPFLEVDLPVLEHPTVVHMKGLPRFQPYDTWEWTEQEPPEQVGDPPVLEPMYCIVEPDLSAPYRSTKYFKEERPDLNEKEGGGPKRLSSTWEMVLKKH